MYEFFTRVYEFLLWSGSWRVILQNTLMIALLVTALVWCGKPEKIVISIWVIVHEAHAYLDGYFEVQEANAMVLWSSVNQSYLLADIMLMIGFLALALNANRKYVLWIAALQVLALLAHVVRAITDELTVFVYILIVVGAGWLQLFLMLGGQIAYLRRKPGVYPDWRWQVALPGPARKVN